jgi:hypothetical protein
LASKVNAGGCVVVVLLNSIPCSFLFLLIWLAPILSSTLPFHFCVPSIDRHLGGYGCMWLILVIGVGEGGLTGPLILDWVEVSPLIEGDIGLAHQLILHYGNLVLMSYKLLPHHHLLSAFKPTSTLSRCVLLRRRIVYPCSMESMLVPSRWYRLSSNGSLLTRHCKRIRNGRPACFLNGFVDLSELIVVNGARWP